MLLTKNKTARTKSNSYIDFGDIVTKSKLNNTHKPVLLDEIIEGLKINPSGTYIDATCGEGGHSFEIIKHLNKNGTLLSLDTDSIILEKMKARISKQELKILKSFHTNYIYIKDILEKVSINSVDGILFDLGLSLYQIKNSGRGFSFNANEPLDMRFDINNQIKADDIVNKSSLAKLQYIIKTYGEEKHSNIIAKYILINRPIQNSFHLAEIIRNIKRNHPKHIDPSTRTFQAIRIAVNDEMENIKIGLKEAIKSLKIGARLAVITYHSLEDRIVKQLFKRYSRECICPPSTPFCICNHRATIKIINKKVIRPNNTEILSNKSSRSAKLRIIEALDNDEKQFEREAT